MLSSPSEDTSPTRVEGGRVWFLPLLLTTALATLALQAWQWWRVPAESDARIAATFVSSRLGDTDAFTVVPDYDSRPRVTLQDAAYMPSAEPVVTDLSPYQNLYAIVETGHETTFTGQLPSGWTAESLETFGRWTVFKASTKARPWNVLDALKDARVERRRKGAKPEHCNRYSSGEWQRWDCGKRQDAFLYVGEAMQLVTNDPHRCLWAMPIDNDGTLSIEYKGVDLSAGLEGRLGQTFDAVRSERGAPVHFSVFVDDKPGYQTTLGLHDEGFLPFELPSAGNNATLRFEVNAQNQVDRFFCFSAWSLK